MARGRQRVEPVAKRIEWTDGTRGDVRRIERQNAMRILEGLARFVVTDEGASSC